MPVLTVRGVPEEIHCALRMRAAVKGHSMEAEVREILKVTLKPETEVKIGDALANLGRRLGLTSEDFAAMEGVRENAPAEPIAFE